MIVRRLEDGHTRTEREEYKFEKNGENDKFKNVKERERERGKENDKERKSSSVYEKERKEVRNK